MARLALSESPSGFGLGWLAPATATLLLVGVLVNQHIGPAASSRPDSGLLVATILSNQSAAAYLPRGYQLEQNGLPTETLEWTNGGGFTSSIHSLWAPKANHKK